MTILIKICIFFANVFYCLIKLFPTNNKKITFISRQSNNESLDMILLKEELLKLDSNLKIKVLCKRLEDGLFNKIKYIFHIFSQMYHIATSKVVILDSYCIPVCILKHKKSLTVIQMWHALGSLKKFGYAAFDKKDGRDSKLSKTMKMHKNYDYILTSSEISKPFFREAFNAKDENMLVMNLPRVDFLKDKKISAKIKKDFYGYYPEVPKNKKIILYCPTSRKDDDLPLEKMKASIDYQKYIFIIKLHNNDNQICYGKNDKYEEIHFSGMEMLHIADYIITDYSAIVYEAAVTEKPIYLYTFDYDKYVDDRGFFINYKKEMPGLISKDFSKIIKEIENNKYDAQKSKEFLNKYIGDLKTNWTKEFSLFIIDKLK